MSVDPRISVVIPSSNGAFYRLKDALDGLFRCGTRAG